MSNLRWLTSLTITCLCVSAAKPALSQSSLESAVGYFADNNRTSMLSSTAFVFKTRQIFSGEGTESAFSLGLGIKRITFKDSDNYTVKEQLNGNPNLQQTSLSFDYSQGLGIGTDVGAFTGMMNSALGSSNYFGLRFGQYWLSETFQTIVEVRKAKSKQKSAQVYGSDVSHVILPEDLEGSNYTLRVKHLTTPTTILLANYSLTKSSDRPDAQGASAEGRQFIPATKGALHLSVSHYENIGEIKPITLYGTVVANAVRTEYHQRLENVFPLTRQSIVMFGYRYYSETENPREKDVDYLVLKSDWIYSTLRLRLEPKKRWIDESNEVYVFGGRYATNEPNSGLLAGVGGKINF